MYRRQRGRHFVAVSLLEAETLRANLHLRRGRGPAVDRTSGGTKQPLVRAPAGREPSLPGALVDATKVEAARKTTAIRRRSRGGDPCSCQSRTALLLRNILCV